MKSSKKHFEAADENTKLNKPTQRVYKHFKKRFPTGNLTIFKLSAEFKISALGRDEEFNELSEETAKELLTYYYTLTEKKLETLVWGILLSGPKGPCQLAIKEV